MKNVILRTVVSRIFSPRFFCVCFILLVFTQSREVSAQIDRKAIVDRHKIEYDQYTPEAPASLGNGEFAYTFDITGMQTFPSAKPGHLPLNSMAQWAWHSFPESKQYRYEDTLENFVVNGREVSYATDMRSETAQAFRANPHRFNLARIGLKLLDKNGERATPAGLASPVQDVELWQGRATSRFGFQGERVLVKTAVHPRLDAVAFMIHSSHVIDGKVSVEIKFPYPAGVWGPEVDNWQVPEKHSTTLEATRYGYRFVRKLDETEYTVEICTSGQLIQGKETHSYVVENRGSETLEIVVHFTQKPEQTKADFEELIFRDVVQASQIHWKAFWQSGGAIDLSLSKDPRWRELERRVVLSQFLTAIHCAGSIPPQETGLLCNSWFGKSHLEMHWWHAAHFAQWGRTELLERSLDWYREIMPAARDIARRQGYAGVRWPKMTGPEGVSSPSEVGELLIWQQPHIIYFAELAYRAAPNRETLERYRELIEATADFMADYAVYNQEKSQFDLGPVLIPAQECYDGRGKSGVLNPTFELAYWRWGLNTANLWRERLGLKPKLDWSEVANKISKPNICEGVYTAISNPPFTRRRDHPSMLAAYGVLPNVGLIDPKTMHRTLIDVKQDWQWPDTWGWDFPMMAMTAARLQVPHDAVDFLLMETPKNHYLKNGHCRQEDRLPIYLPANGGLLSAVAMMAAGWDGASEDIDAPGFPQDGTWSVRHEGLRPMP